MVQNRNKLIDLFVGNISNSIIHKILERAVGGEDIADRYRKEKITSFEIAKRYREKINPKNKSFSRKNVDYIRNKVVRRVKSELLLRIEKGYKNIDISIVEQEINNVLKEMIII